MNNKTITLSEQSIQTFVELLQEEIILAKESLTMTDGDDEHIEHWSERLVSAKHTLQELNNQINK